MIVLFLQYYSIIIIKNKTDDKKLQLHMSYSTKNICVKLFLDQIIGYSIAWLKLILLYFFEIFCNIFIIYYTRMTSDEHSEIILC